MKEYTLSCPNGHEALKSKTVKQLEKGILCPICNQGVNLKNGTVKMDSTVVPFFEKRGGIAFDGITSMSDWVMDDLQKRRGRGELKGEESAIGTLKSGELDFGGNNRADYMFTQARALEWISNSLAIQGLSIPPLFTALEAKGEERDFSKLPVYGPQLVGSAKTAAVPAWVGDCLGTVVVDGQYRIYLRDYKLDDNVVHKCKVRVEPGYLPEYLADEQGEETFSKCSLNYLFKEIDKVHEEAFGRAKKKHKDAPGPPKEKLYELPKGDGSTVAKPTSAARRAGPVMPVRGKASPIRGR
jgi:hypothetical protein